MVKILKVQILIVVEIAGAYIPYFEVYFLAVLRNHIFETPLVKSAREGTVQGCAGLMVVMSLVHFARQIVVLFHLGRLLFTALAFLLFLKAGLVLVFGGFLRGYLGVLGFLGGLGGVATTFVAFVGPFELFGMLFLALPGCQMV